MSFTPDTAITLYDVPTGAPLLFKNSKTAASSFEQPLRDAFFEEHRRMALLVSYCGAAYAGSQFQKQGHRCLPTIEFHLREAFKRLALKDIRLSMASRTDAGVHALGQVAHVRLSEQDSQRLNKIDNLQRALNRYLPADIAIQAIAPWAHPQFHAQQTPKRRWYRYVIYNHSERHPLLAPYAHWEYSPLNIDTMQAAASVLVGSHVMSAFKGSPAEAAADSCHLEHLRVYCPAPRWIVVDLVANRFLYQMVRIIVGTLIELAQTGRTTQRRSIWWRGSWQPSPNTIKPAEKMQQIMNVQNRQLAGKTAPARGLTLLGIDYPPPFDYFKTHWCDLYTRDLLPLV
ncbi:MAG: tRNA pseudouridine synthase A [Vampirovibrionales bacterium]|nr:tRNA pseudouridine synthase A [Vampirovibrionales bacterium]